MIGKKRNDQSGERLDQIGREIVRASASNEAEGELAAASPFLYTRLRSRIAAERGQREEREGWLTMLGVVWRAIPAMALIAILAVALFISANFGAGPAGVVADEGFLDPADAGIESVVYADNRSLSNDEVLATILNEDELEAAR
jgi:hypothetical protein